MPIDEIAEMIDAYRRGLWYQRSGMVLATPMMTPDATDQTTIFTMTPTEHTIFMLEFHSRRLAVMP